MVDIFLVEDDFMVAKNLILVLKSQGFRVTHGASQAEALGILSGFEMDFDLALIDISLPDGSGFTVYREWKEIQDKPVIFLTAFADESSIITGLDMGADDYITKPFKSGELLARIRACLRRQDRVRSDFHMGNIHVDMEKGVVKKEGMEVFLSALEYRLFLIFINNPNMIIPRSRLLDDLWEATGEFVNDNTLTVYIKRLRHKIEDDPSKPKLILTLRGRGYRLGGHHT